MKSLNCDHSIKAMPNIVAHNYGTVDPETT